MTSKGGIQLPDDAVSAGYKQTRPFHYEQVFRSEAKRFTGTEREFVAAGFAYEYYENDFQRHVK